MVNSPQKEKKHLYFLKACRLVCGCAPLECGIYLLLTVILGFLPAILVTFETKFIDTSILVFQETIDSRVIVEPLAAVLMILSFLWITKSIKGILSTFIKSNISDHICPKILEKEASLPYQDYENSEIRDLMKRVAKEPEKILTQCFEEMLTLCSSFIAVISILSLMIHYVPLIVVIVLAASFLLFYVAIKRGRKNYEATKEALALERYSDYYGSVLTGRETEYEKSLFQFTDFLNQKWEKNVSQYNKIILRTKVKWFLDMKAGAVAVAVIGMLMGVLLLNPLIRGTLTIGFFISIINAINQLTTKLSWQLTDTVDGLVQHIEYVKDYEELMNLSVVDRMESKLSKTQDGRLHIVFSHVSFQYPNANDKALNDLTFEIREGYHYAFVGVNGAGKTTIFKLLVGLYREYQGEIYINEKNLKAYTNEELSDIFSVIFQDYARYQLSIGENITFCREREEKRIKELKKAKDSSASIKSFLQEVNLQDKVGKIFEEGKELSQGQWQKIAILRSLVREAKCYILDEPTSAMDPLSEKGFYHEYAEMTNQKTSIAISHRLGSIKGADQIFVLEKGTIIASGTHEELLENCQLYDEMYQKQKGWYMV